MTSSPETVRGANLGILFPTSLDSLRERCPAFLTEAFRVSGALSADNEVTSVTRFDEFIGGGAGRKLWLSVSYRHDEPGLHTELFVKFPRDFGDPLRPLFSHLMEPEARFALLSRRSGFPVAVPSCYFADYDPDTSTGLIITERIPYGDNGVEPFFDKCLDYDLPDPAAHYRALTTAIARLAAGHKSGPLGSGVDEQFPFELGHVCPDDRIPYSVDELGGKLDALTTFADRYPNLLPPHLRSHDFLATFAEQVPPFLERELEVKRYLNSNPDFVALCHWNANVDNAWFERGPDGELVAGLLDWGSVGQMNVAQAIYGILCATETDIWDAHKDELVAHFADEYHRNGGPELDLTELNLHLRLFIAMLGIAWMLDAPSLVESQLPDLEPDVDRHDDALRGDFLARAQLQLMTVFLHAWQSEDIPGALRQVPNTTGQSD